LDATTVRICGTNFGKRYPLAGDDSDKALPATRPVDAATPMPSPSPLVQREPAAADETRGSRPAAARSAKTEPSETHGNAWLDAFSALHRQTAAAHAEFQRLLAGRHAAFPQASTEGLRQLAILAGAGPLEAEPPATALETPRAGDAGEIMTPPPAAV